MQVDTSNYSPLKPNGCNQHTLGTCSDLMKDKMMSSLMDHLIGWCLWHFSAGSYSGCCQVPLTHAAELDWHLQVLSKIQWKWTVTEWVWACLPTPELMRLDSKSSLKTLNRSTNQRQMLCLLAGVYQSFPPRPETELQTNTMCVYRLDVESVEGPGLYLPRDLILHH